MKTGLHKRDKTTEINFDEQSPVTQIRTHNTDLKNRLTAYAEQHPDLCKLTGQDEKTGYKAFEIDKRRFSCRLIGPIQRGTPQGGKRSGEI